MDEEFLDEQDPYNPGAREIQLDNGEIDAEEEGFIKGYEDDADNSEDNSDLDDDEVIRD